MTPHWVVRVCEREWVGKTVGRWAGQVVAPWR